ncbi:MAG: DAK2 domain-containing protein [Chloroflexi bacterium]|nr:DAK2 domain-containing protein [Chloroflexota bacterium]
MKQIETIGGQEFKEMLSASISWLEKSAEDINELNVFPVPDGDTGTNMLLTMRSGIEEALQCKGSDVSPIAQAMSNGTLMGARGNSGVILSQVWNGIARGLKGKGSIGGIELAYSLNAAVEQSYKSMSDPVEGTILTVMKDAAKAAQTQVGQEQNDIVSVMEAAVNAARDSVANTPNLLAVLRDAGVVDAGGQGLYTILEGALLYLKGEVDLMQFRKSHVIAISATASRYSVTLSEKDEEAYGYCTEFLLKGEDMDIVKIRRKLSKKGESLMVVGDENTVRVHIHTLDPGSVIHYVASLGTMHTISIRNMDEQHEDFLALQKEKTPALDTAIIAVASGDGIFDVLGSLGVSAIVPGGQSMNPSTKDILQLVENAPSGKIIILPNNKNIIATAQQVQALTSKKIAVIPTTSIPQGVAALLAFDYEADFDSNIQLMTEALPSVRTIEITRANRSTHINGLSINKHQAIGLLDGKLISVNDLPSAVLDELLSGTDLSSYEVATIYYGADTNAQDAEKVGSDVRQKFSGLQVEVVHGGQPYYNFIVSLE